MTDATAPGWPGIPPRWTSSAKSGVGTAATSQSRVWFTISHGIINEVYFPRLDQANTRDLGLLITDGSVFFSEEKRHTASRIYSIANGVPGYRMVNTCTEGRYRVTKTVVTDPERDVLLQRVLFEPLQNCLDDYCVYALIAPHISNCGFGNNGWTGDYKGIPMLFAERAGTSLALACSTPFESMSCGHVGVSDGWQDISRNKRMTCFYSKALDGNIALTGAINLATCGGDFVLALAFGGTSATAGQLARAALLQDFEEIVREFVKGWETVQTKFIDLSPARQTEIDFYRISTAVLKTHESIDLPGCIIASLSVPWGSSKGDEDLGGYHLVWPRDLVESAGALLAAGDTEAARRTLFYLMCTQETDGHWPQNMWQDGAAYWNGIQMDEVALPILLADALRRADGLKGLNVWPMVHAAAAYIVRNGPVTQEDRWEEDEGYSPFTLAAEVAALLAAADFADEAGASAAASYLRETADAWNENIERWIYATHTELSERSGVEGYYMRLASIDAADAASPFAGFVPIKNRPPEQSRAPASFIVSPDALALVRFGLRSPNDPRIVNTVKVIDTVLKTETTTGPLWHRYSQDGYGEHEDGRPFDGNGVGRGWPLLAGERAHYELAAGNRAEAERLRDVITAQSSDGGLIPEQVWDASDIPELELFNGRPSGSAMPLVWAHAEYIKLMRSLRDGRIFDLPPQTVERYQVRQTRSPHAVWRFNQKCGSVPAGKVLRIETLFPAVVHWGINNWRRVEDIKGRDTGWGVYTADLATGELPAGTTVQFTFFWHEADRWEGTDFEVFLS